MLLIDIERVSNQTGISKKQLKRILNGSSKPSLDTAIKLSKCTGIPVETIASIERKTSSAKKSSTLKYAKKLNKEKAIEIRLQFAKGNVTMSSLANAHGVSVQAISDVINNNSYKTSTEPEMLELDIDKLRIDL